MQNEEYKKMYELESTYWWYTGRREIIRSVFNKYAGKTKTEQIIDIGCGTGINLDILKNYGKRIIGVDNSEVAISYAKERGYEDILLVNDISKLPYSDNTTGIITMLDVLEHLPEENKALKECHRILKNGGLLIVTVPAYQFLWSEHDIALHHYRRYTARKLKHILEQNNFRIVKISYIISFLLPLVIIYRLFKGLINIFFKSVPRTSHVIVPQPINNFFISLLNIESLLVRYFNLPLGTSVIGVAKKK